MKLVGSQPRLRIASTATPTSRSDQAMRNQRAPRLPCLRQQTAVITATIENTAPVSDTMIEPTR